MGYAKLASYMSGTSVLDLSLVPVSSLDVTYKVLYKLDLKLLTKQ